MSEISEFEKWLITQESTRPPSIDDPEWGWRHTEGARAAHDWILNKAKELSLFGLNDCEVVKLEDLEEACK